MGRRPPPRRRLLTAPVGQRLIKPCYGQACTALISGRPTAGGALSPGRGLGGRLRAAGGQYWPEWHPVYPHVCPRSPFLHVMDLRPAGEGQQASTFPSNSVECGSGSPLCSGLSSRHRHQTSLGSPNSSSLGNRVGDADSDPPLSLRADGSSEPGAPESLPGRLFAGRSEEDTWGQRAIWLPGSQPSRGA